jgi:hypothetical protein
MRKIVLTTVVTAALVGAGMAVAYRAESKSVKAVSATFTATGASVGKTSSCTGADGTYTGTKATYTGTSTSTDPNLNGAVTIKTESLVNTTTNLGTVSGRIDIQGASGARSVANFTAVYSNGRLGGLAIGHTAAPATLLGNLSAGFSTTGGFMDGKIGGATSGGDAVTLTSGGCRPVKAPRPDRIQVHGAVSTVTASSLTAGGVTCAIPTDLQSAVTKLGLAAGSQVEMTCTVANGANTLTRLEKRGGHEPEHGKKEKTRRH